MALITKNGFKFCHIPLEIWNSDDQCLACHELPHEQTTVNFYGSWYDASGKHYDKFTAEFTIYVENSSSKWVCIEHINYLYEATVGTHQTWANFINGPLSTYDDYLLIQLFNPYDAFDLSQLTLTSPDRLDAKGTYYINWQTYQFQNNGEQLIKDAIKQEFADSKDALMQTYGLLLRGLRILGIEEWLPGDTKKLNIEILDRKRFSSYDENYKIPFRHNAYLYLDNRHGNIHYCDNNENVFHQTAFYELFLTYYVKEESYTEEEENAPYIVCPFTVHNWSSDKDIYVQRDIGIFLHKKVSNIQGPDAIWKEIQFQADSIMTYLAKASNYPRFGFFSLKLESVEGQFPIYFDYIYNTDADKFRTQLNFRTKPNDPHYYININGNKYLDDKIEVGSTKIYDVSFLLPTTAQFLNDKENTPLGVWDLNVKVVNDKNKSFTASLTDINISEYSNGNVGTTKLNVTCNNKDFSLSTRIEVSLNPRWEYNLSDEHIPVDYLSFYSPPEFVIPEGTVLNIYNNKCDRLTFQTHSFSSTDKAEFNITFESPDEAEFKKRKIEFDFQKDGTAFNLIFKDNVNDRSKRVFYNFTDKVFTGTIKFTWKVNGEEFTNVHEIPVIYHNERYASQHPDKTIWDPNGSVKVSYKSASSYINEYSYFYGYGDIFSGGFKSAADYGCHVISSNSNIFEKAEFGIYREIGYLTLSNIKENQYVNPRQTRINIYLKYEDDNGQLKYIDDPEMWPSTYIDVIQDGTGLADPVIEDDSLYGDNDDQNILRLNNMVSTPITQNNYSVNMQTKEQPQLTISDDLYFLDSSPVYVDGNQKQVILKYYTTLTGIPSVTFTNTEGFLPGINSVQVDAQQKAVTVNMNYNKGQTTQGYVTLTIGTRSVSMGVFQNKSEQYFDLKLTSYSITYSPITFGIKYTK